MRVIPLRISSVSEAGEYMRALKVDPAGLDIMAPKTVLRSFRVKGISSYAANIIKQHLLSLGSDAALSRSCLIRRARTDILIFGTQAQLGRFLEKIKHQPFGLKELASQLAPYLGGKNVSRVFRARDKRIRFTKCILCGIINVTPDSFSGDGLLAGAEHTTVIKSALEKAGEMVSSGIRILDVGGESTRPFSRPVSPEEERRRVQPVIRALRREFKKVMISVDTCKYAVAKAAADEGADIINDITALRHAPNIASLVKKYRLGCVLMHMKGTPRTMQCRPVYKGDPVDTIMEFLGKRIDWCLEKGIERDRIMIDPGIGFGKDTATNCALIHRVHEFKALGVPVFLGLSRKRFIGDILNDREAERLSGTIAAGIVASCRGADVLRVHDTTPFSRAFRVVDTIMSN